MLLTFDKALKIVVKRGSCHQSVCSIGWKQALRLVVLDFWTGGTHGQLWIDSFGLGCSSHSRWSDVRASELWFGSSKACCFCIKVLKRGCSIGRVMLWALLIFKYRRSYNFLLILGQYVRCTSQSFVRWVKITEWWVRVDNYRLLHAAYDSVWASIVHVCRGDAIPEATLVHGSRIAHMQDFGRHQART